MPDGAPSFVKPASSWTERRTFATLQRYANVFSAVVEAMASDAVKKDAANMNRAITVTPLVGALGAEIGDIDLSRGLADHEVALIRSALLEHLVVFFRAQTLSAA